ncbi:redox-regulated ATPase YchF [Buchnera aphidicola (Thelaxes californica)]|uniref:Ribosome-binding ATPase YchF n=1 Tax=Buchnera aphidicola (Thelaxes californica) TaxID=1315998 RepID=A0A4D6YC81_9GAMM|nr:redox-regulated ATPase YchF [Buchnera aphidicola]QCI26702.1 redox-regulated ATPase YchF [Buchnera aphidicola (Thelaxes californica)]
MGFKCGLIGLPNVGKSTLFNILTQSNVPSENYPFCTIEPNISIVPVFDHRLKTLQKIVFSKNVVPTTMEFVDIAGLVKNAHSGEGLGNQFLQNIRNVDALVHVVRCFLEKNIVHCYDQINPIQDIELILLELIFADIYFCELELKSFEKQIKKKNSELIKQKITLLSKCLTHLKKQKMLKSLILNDIEEIIISSFNFITKKPIMYIANISKIKSNTPNLDLFNNFCKKNNTEIIQLCIEYEKQKILCDNKIKKNWKNNNNSVIQKIILSGYKLLNLNTFFTVGKKEIKAWTLKHGDNITEAAGKIHSDMKRGFIRAQVMSYEDFIKYNGEIGVKKIGKYRTEGKKYIVQDGDIINILFNV